MSTEINTEKLYENCIKILTDLIGFKTISGDDNSNLINYCEDYLQKLGATSFKTFDEEKKRVNLFASFKAKKTNGIKPTIKDNRNNYLLIREIEIINTNDLFEL